MADNDDRYKCSFKVDVVKYFIKDQEDKSGKSHVAEINVVHNSSKWKLNKSYDDFSILHENFTTFLPCQIDLPSLELSSAENLTEYIVQVTSYCDSKIWDHPILLRFLDDMYGKSSISKVQLNELSKKVGSLEEQLEATIAKNSSLVTLLMELNDRVSLLESQKKTSAVVSLNSLTSSNHSESKPSSRLSSSGETTTTPLNLSGERRYSPMVTTDILNALESSMHSGMGIGMGMSMHSIGMRDEDDDFSTVDVIAVKTTNGTNIQTSSNIVESAATATILLEPDFSSSYDKSLLLPISFIPTNKEPNEVDIIFDDLIQLIRPHDEQIKYRKSIQMTAANFIKRNVGCRVFDPTLFAVKCFLPDDGLKLSLVMSRTIPTNWYLLLFEKLLKLSEGGGGGGNNSNGFDFNDMMMMKDNSNINNMSSDNEADEILSDIDVTDENAYDGSNNSSSNKQPQQPRSLYYNHLNFDNNISNVAHSTVNGESAVTFNVDLLQVEIASNPRTDLTMLSFLEEFSHLVGKDFLFKRCFLLVRAWWIYETAAYIGCPMKHYLSDAALSIMLCSVFNLYHENIHTPFQGLCIFLAEYGDFDWTTYVITLQGIVPFRGATAASTSVSSSSSSVAGDKDKESNVPWLRLPKPHHLANEEFISKYKNVLSNNVTYYNTSPRTIAVGTGVGMNTSFTSNEASNSTTPKGSFNMGGFFNEPLDGGGIAGESTNNNNTSQSQPPSLHTSNHVNYQQQQIQQPISENTLNSFERLSLNIVNPFTHTNMIADKLNSRRAKRVIKVFQMGARNLCSTIKSLTSSGKSNGSDTSGDASTPIHIPLLSFFRNVHNRFGSGWRPDVINKSLPTELILHRDLLIWTLLKSNSNKSLSKSSPRVSTRSIFEYLWNQVSYCNVVQDSIVNDLGLLILCKEILIDRGTLPVGEIGKNLQEIGKISSNRLKEKFGGLKKFLERYPEDFVVSTDHPFNPHVFLRKLISQEDTDSIYRGAIPKSLLERMEKFKKSLAKKKSASSVLSLSDSVIMVDRNSSGSMVNTSIHSSMDQQHSMVQRGYLMANSNGVFNSINNINNNNNNMINMRSRQGGLTGSGSSNIGGDGNANFIQQSRRKNGILTTSGSSISSMNSNMLLQSPTNSGNNNNNNINMFSIARAQRPMSPPSNISNWNSSQQQYSNQLQQQQYHNSASNSLHNSNHNTNSVGVLGNHQQQPIVDRLRMGGGPNSLNNSFLNNNSSNSHANNDSNNFNLTMNDGLNNNEAISAGMGGLRKASSSSVSSVLKDIGIGLGFSNSVAPTSSESLFSDRVNNNNNNNTDQRTLTGEFRGYFNHSDHNNHPNKFDDQFLFYHLNQQQNLQQQPHQSINSATGSDSRGTMRSNTLSSIDDGGNGGTSVGGGHRSQYSVPIVTRDEYATLVPTTNKEYNIFQK